MELLSHTYPAEKPRLDTVTDITGLHAVWITHRIVRGERITGPTAPHLTSSAFRDEFIPEVLVHKSSNPKGVAESTSAILIGPDVSQSPRSLFDSSITNERKFHGEVSRGGESLAERRCFFSFSKLL